MTEKKKPVKKEEEVPPVANSDAPDYSYESAAEGPF